MKQRRNKVVDHRLPHLLPLHRYAKRPVRNDAGDYDGLSDRDEERFRERERERERERPRQEEHREFARTGLESSRDLCALAFDGGFFDTSRARARALSASRGS